MQSYAPFLTYHEISRAASKLLVILHLAGVDDFRMPEGHCTFPVSKIQLLFVQHSSIEHFVIVLRTLK
jgi:hypothetical protein